MVIKASYTPEFRVENDASYYSCWKILPSNYCYLYRVFRVLNPGL
jgi:hypothetical protein